MQGAAGTAGVDADRRYCRDERDATQSRALDDMLLLYHPRSGQTHMVISPVPEILDRMAQDEPVTAQEMQARLARDFDMGPADEAASEIAAHLDALVELGLLRIA